MKKVLFTSTTDSFIWQFLNPYLEYFKKEGYEVHVATGETKEFDFCDKKYVVPFERSPFKKNNLKAIKELKKIINNEKYDIIHTHTPMGSVVTRLAAINARKNGTRVMYTAHGFHFYKGAPIHYWLFYYTMEKMMSYLTDDIITINQEDYNLAKKKFKSPKVHFIEGIGLDVDKFNFNMNETEKNNLKKSLGLSKKDFILIYPAEISKRKRQEWLIKIMEPLLLNNKNIHVLLPGKDSLNGSCHNLVKELKIEDQVHLLGYRNDIPSLVKISDVAISTSRQEGLPVNLLESMYVGLPLVVTDCRGNRDLVENGKNGYIVDKDDQEGFREKILTLYNRKDVNEFSKYNSKKIKKYLLNNVMKDMKKIYNK